MKLRCWRKRIKLYCLFVFLLSLFLINSSAFAKPVSVETAIQVAENWLSQLTGLEQESIDVIPDDQGAFLADGSGEETLPAYYIVITEQGGWAIVSGDDIAQPIIGYGTQGAIDPEDFPPAFIEWMDNVREQIQAAAQDDALQQDGSELAAKIQSAWENLAVGDYGINDDSLGAVAPLVKTTWSQGKYYNTKCPADSAGPDGHALVGCCATAIGQVMKFHNWPATGRGSHSYVHSKYGTLSADFGATNYNWSSIPSAGKVTSYNSAVATLLYHVGVSIDMNYGPNLSGCGPNNIAKSLGPNFRYKPVTFVYRSGYTDSVWKGKIRTDLNAGRPIVYTGTGTGGHAFVCDGYTGTEYFHFNWGWNGSYDGYFYIDDLTPGSYNWNTDQGAIFGITPDRGSMPGKATLISPKGTITDNTPTYTWNAVSDATWYYLWVNDSSGKKIGQWYRSADVLSGSICKVTPTTQLKDGAGMWWIRTWNSSGYGPWSAGMSFTVKKQGSEPGKATLISPKGTITDNTPTYTWNAVSDATWYYLWVNDSSGKKIGQWYRSADVLSGSTCKVTPTTQLKDGAGMWWIQTWNSSGDGPWSAGMSFTVKKQGSKPGRATLISPKGTITDNTPNYDWKEVSDATWYRLWVNDSSGNRIHDWYRATSVCRGSFCRVTPSTQLKDGAGRWWIQTYNSSGYGPWSAAASFNLNAAAGGFDSEFKGEMKNWFRLAAAPDWRVVNKEYLYTDGVARKDATIYYGSYRDTNTMYADFDYEVKLWRKDSTGNYANGICFRGSPYPPGNENRWDRGYWFSYSTGGYYSIWKLTGGHETALKGWTRSNAIHKGQAWNVLGVSAHGSTMVFYINGYTVATVTNSSYSKGKAGIIMYRESETGPLWVDYAALRTQSRVMADNEESAADDDAVVIDEAAVMEQGGDYSDGDGTGVGNYLPQDESVETAPGATPEGLTSPGPIPEVQVKSDN